MAPLPQGCSSILHFFWAPLPLAVGRSVSKWTALVEVTEASRALRPLPQGWILGGAASPDVL
eukprot:8455678-Alexandrium_andersonii.AAC.1